MYCAALSFKHPLQLDAEPVGRTCAAFRLTLMCLFAVCYLRRARRDAERADRPFCSRIRRRSARQALQNKVPLPARTRPASARARVLTARVPCSHRHSIATRGRESGGTAGRCAAARDGSLPQAGPADDGRGKRRGAVPNSRRAATARAVITRKVGMARRKHGAVVALSQSLILQRVRVCHVVIWLCVLSDVCAVCARATRAISSFRYRHHLARGPSTYARFEA